MKTATELCVCVCSSACHTHMTVQLVTSLLTPTQTHQCPYCLLQPQLWTRRQGHQRRRVDVAHRSTFPIPPKTRAAILTGRGWRPTSMSWTPSKLWKEKQNPHWWSLFWFVCFPIWNVIKVTAKNVLQFLQMLIITSFSFSIPYYWFKIYPWGNNLMKRHVVSCKVEY